MQINNYTQISNEFIENMHLFSGSAVKIFLSISRKTIGWHKLTDRISYSQLKKTTGLSTNSLKSGIKELINADFIIQTSLNHEDKSIAGYIYDLNIKDPVSKIDTPVSKIDTKNIETVSKIDTTKDKTKETINKERALSILNEDIEEIYNHYPTRDVVQNYSTGKCKSNKLEIRALLKTRTKDEIIHEMDKHIAERKRAKLSIKTLSNFLVKFPDKEELPTVDVSKMTDAEAIEYVNRRYSE